jgi:hypothetical protein
LKTDEYRQALRSLLDSTDAGKRIEAYLLEHSNLPGPRGNLELAYALAGELASGPIDAQLWARLGAWAELSAAEAGTGDRREYLPFCATVALGALYAPEARKRPQILRRLRLAANDPRWRMREASAIALQSIGEYRGDELFEVLGQWLRRPTLLELRAVAAALAHPPLLEDEGFARTALRLAERVLASAARQGPQARRSEEFRALRQGLGYALSVLAAALPEEGLAMLERWARSGDRDVAWIIKENLKKKRLAGHGPRLKHIAELLGGE